ncbi:MAG: hypothetical protein MUE74_07475, partial [Bacteroidales bacterium]|nr:hypothetical protein [Bacteroidales bacterium]
MEVFTMFLLKSAAWLTGFLLVYLLFLKNERFFAIKRYYLVAGILASFVFPLVSFHYSVVVTAPPVSQVLQVQDFQGRSLSTAESLNTGTVNYKLLAAGIYLMILLILITRLLKQLYFFRRMIRKGEVSCSGRARIVKIPGLKSSFSFFRYIFIGSSVDESEATHILNHEEVHVSQRHWFDLLLAEVVKTLQWINPFAWIYAVQIRQNHEFLADEAALKKISDPGSYRAVLLNHIFNAQVLPLSNSFSYSNNKKRFVMMDKITIPPYRKYKLLIMIPVAATIFYAFATPEYQYAAPANNSAITDIATSMQKTIPLVVTSAGDTIKEPLLVIDGVIQEKRVWIDPDNINTISVLKDESATAVFGDKGKNGVVIVTLKKPAGTVETREIRGSVVSGDGKALEGACIVINGTTVGTISDSRGAFRLTNVA